MNGAVSDTSPLCYLVLIEQVDLLPALFRQVHIAAAVRDELCQDGAPPSVRDWAKSAPSWLMVHDNPQDSSSSMVGLQAGERNSILLAEKLNASIIVVDERAARRTAERRGLEVTGTLGVLGEAAKRGWIDLSFVVSRLLMTNFRCSPAFEGDPGTVRCGLSFRFENRAARAEGSFIPFTGRLTAVPV